MVLGHGHRKTSSASNRSSVDESREPATDDETVVDAEQGNVLGHIISQLRPGADLSRVTLPTFILEPRSMLERITNFMAHPEILRTLTSIDDPVLRFVAVTKFYLSGWHIKPPGVKKPLNPILGETFTCWWDYPDKTRGYYIAEQTSHHPPKSSYFFMAPHHGVRIDGTLKPRSKFLGNSAASLMEGIAVMRFLNTNERYFITQPNMYARGILFGKMKYELGDHAFLRCPETGLMADLEFKTKGYFGGTYNAIGGFIKDSHTDKALYELSGFWNGEMFIKNLTASTGKKELLFDATHAHETPPTTRPLEEQGERESQRLWHPTVIAIKNKDHVAATDEKSKIEDMQREEASKRTEDGVEWRPRLFRAVQGGPGGPDDGEEDLDFKINAKVDGQSPEELTKQILSIAAILPGQQVDRRFSIPERKAPLQVSSVQGSTDAQVSSTQIEQGQNSTNGDLIDTDPGHVLRPPTTGAGQHNDILPAIQNNPPGAPQTAGAAGKKTNLEKLADGTQKAPLSGSRGHGGGGSELPSLRRMDSETNAVEEFHDAES
ncbi:hypothetical protein EJ08DRAFT_612544 [Tothia fuscella]|uniref:Oxysterol-binding protein n=1 Tax=Tothia fuscella TaxID=1048955 RepID=A0A9P4TYM5_9PEZI|nr:hypothetical protein EJ08DRAFT_612544 [Tothia fuscella]